MGARVGEPRVGAKVDGHLANLCADAFAGARQNGAFFPAEAWNHPDRAEPGSPVEPRQAAPSSLDQGFPYVAYAFILHLTMRRFLALLIAFAGIALAVAMLTRVRFTAPSPAATGPLTPSPSSPAAPSPVVSPVPAVAAPRLWTHGIVEPAGGLRRVAAPVSGIVAKLAVKPGDTVQEGDLLAFLDDRDARAAAELAQAQLAAAGAKTKAADAVRQDRAEQLARAERLRADRAASDEEVQRVRFALRAAEAAVTQARAEEAAATANAARAVLAVELLAVRAPTAGTVVRVGAFPGEAVRPEDGALVLLTGPGDPGVRGDLEAAARPGLRAGAPAVARARDAAGRELAWPVRLERIDPPMRADGPASIWLAFEGRAPEEAHAGLAVEVWERGNETGGTARP